MGRVVFSIVVAGLCYVASCPAPFPRGTHGGKGEGARYHRWLRGKGGGKTTTLVFCPSLPLSMMFDTVVVVMDGFIFMAIVPPRRHGMSCHRTRLMCMIAKGRGREGGRHTPR